MSKKYIDSILNDVFKSSDNRARRQLSESENTHHAIITRDYMERAYAIGLLANDIEFTQDDLTKMSDKFKKGITKGIGNKTNVTWKETKLGGGGIIVTVKPRKTKSKAKSDTALKDIKSIVDKGKDYARPLLDELVEASGGTTKGFVKNNEGKRRLNTSGSIESGLSYAHGEGGGPISTLGTERGLDVLKQINPKDVEKYLDSKIKDGNLFMHVVQTHMVDYYQNTLKWDVVRKNPANNKLIVDDDLEITGAFIYQDPNFAAQYDLPRNSPDKGFEERYKATLRDELVTALNKAVTDGALRPDQLEGSPTPVKRAQVISVKTIINELEKEIKKADKRGVVTIEKALEKIKNSKARAKSQVKIKKAKGKIRGVTTGAIKRPTRKTSAVANSHADASPIALKSLLQKVLPAEIARRMTGPPTLMYQTGRFAQSAEITDIAPMKKSVEIRYDYMQDPYRVFERGSGSPLASVGRDPRGLIGGTIRDLAQQLMGDKFLVRTKRV